MVKAGVFPQQSQGFFGGGIFFPFLFRFIRRDPGGGWMGRSPGYKDGDQQGGVWKTWIRFGFQPGVCSQVSVSTRAAAAVIYGQGTMLLLLQVASSSSFWLS